MNIAIPDFVNLYALLKFSGLEHNRIARATCSNKVAGSIISLAR